MNILVLGGGGFIGSTLVKALLRVGHSVRVFDRNEQYITTVPVHNSLVWIKGSFEDENALDSSLSGIDVVFHLIATTTPATSSHHAVPDIAGNVLPSIFLLETMKAQSVNRIIFISSGGTVYGKANTLPISEHHTTNPIVSHGIHKLTIEKYLLLYMQQHGLSTTIIRLANPYGPNQIVKGGQGVVSSVLRAAIDGTEFELWGDGTAVRDYIYIEDVVSALLKVVDYYGSELILNLSSSIGVSVNELLSVAKDVTGRAIRISHKPGRNFDLGANILDNSLAKGELNWKPEIDLRRGLQLTFDYMKSTRKG